MAMQFYAYKGDSELNKEGLGTEGKAIWRDLKTVAGAIRRARRWWGEPFRLYTFWNFYNDATFRRVH